MLFTYFGVNYNIVKLKLLHLQYYLPPSSPAGDYNLHGVCACVSLCVCHVVFSETTTELHIFGKLLVLMNFYALQYFGGVGELWPTFE